MKEELERDVDELIRVARKEQYLVIAANSCNTPADHRAANAGEEALEEAREKFIARWGNP